MPKFRTGSQKWFFEDQLYPPYTEVECAAEHASVTWEPLDKEAEAAIKALKDKKAEQRSQSVRIKELEAQVKSLKDSGNEAPRVVEMTTPSGKPAVHPEPAKAVVDDRKDDKHGKRPSDKSAL